MTSPRLRPTAASVALYLGLALAFAQLHAYEIDLGPKEAQAVARHEEVLAGEGEAPWGYRVLAPRLAELTALPGDDGVALSYAGWRFLATFAFLVLFEAWLRRWLEPAWAVAGTLLAAALTPVTYQFYWFQPDSPLDLVLWTGAAVVTVAGGADLALFPMILLGALNRETAVFVAVLHLALRWGEEDRTRLLLRTGGLLATWAATFAALRWKLGDLPRTVSLAELVRQNAHASWWAYALAFLGAWAALPFVGWSRRPPALQRLEIALLVTYLPLQLVFGRVREVRLLLPLVLAGIPLTMLALREASEGSEESRKGHEGR